MPRSAATRHGPVRWWLEERATPSLEALIDDPDRVVEGPTSVARARTGRKRFYRIAGGEGQPALLVKVFRPPSLGARLLGRVRPSKARREARVARQVAARGFDVAAPVAVGEERRGGLPGRSYSVVVERPLRDLRAVLEAPETDTGQRRALVESFAELTRRLHDAGVDQDDSSPNNFLVAPDGRWVLIDFERCRVGPRLGERRWTLLAKLHRHRLGVSGTDRLRFLRAYLQGGDRARRREAWERIRPAYLRVRRNDARRAGRAAFRAGRHVGRDGDAWCVRGREGARTVRVELPRREARALWRVAHQLERLGLPALRPVRLDSSGVELEARDLAECAPAERDAAIRAARARLAPFGSLDADAEWVMTRDGALLADLRAFRLGR